MTHQEYIKKYLWMRVDFDNAYAYQCVDLARHYCGMVWQYLTWLFWGSAYAGWVNRQKTFKWKAYITWFPKDSSTVKVWSVVIFKPGATIMTKYPWNNQAWRKIRFWKDWHVWVIDYIDNDWVMRIIEQNWINGRIINGKRVYDWLWENAIRLMWYQGKDAVAWFILQ